MKLMLGALGVLALLAGTPSYAADQMEPGLFGAKLIVKNMQKSIDFYTKIGMHTGAQRHPMEQEMLWGDAPEGRLYLIQEGSARARRPAGDTSLMFMMPDIRATIKALRDAGYPGIGKGTAHGPSLSLTVKDPDGHDIELLGTTN